jgi:YHS domain-containing protein
MLKYNLYFYFLLLASFILTSGCKHEFESESMILKTSGMNRIDKILVSNSWYVTTSKLTAIRQGSTYYFYSDKRYQFTDSNGNLISDLYSYNINTSANDDGSFTLVTEHGTFNVKRIQDDVLVFFIRSMNNTTLEARLKAVK